MKLDTIPYILDSDVFITAKNSYYAFDICPGFWSILLHHDQEGQVISNDRVRGELLSGRKDEDLVLWVKNKVPKTFFYPVDDEKTTTKYSEIVLWTLREPRFDDSAKAKFATGADGWLVAYASVHGGTIVTLEQPAPKSKQIKLPDICKQFDVPHQNTFQMLRKLGVRFDSQK